jgi:hypothetical protein
VSGILFWRFANKIDTSLPISESQALLTACQDQV